MPTTTPTSSPSLLDGRILAVAFDADIATVTNDELTLILETFSSMNPLFAGIVGRTVSTEYIMTFPGSIIVAALFWGLAGEDIRRIVAVIQRDGLVLEGTGITVTHTAFVLAEFPSRPPSAGPTLYPTTSESTSMPSIIPTASPTFARTLPDRSGSTTDGPDLSSSASGSNVDSTAPIVVGVVFGLLMCVIFIIVVVIRVRRQNQKNSVLTMHPGVQRSSSSKQRKGSSTSVLQMPFYKRGSAPPSKPINDVWTTYVGPEDDPLDDHVDVNDNGAIEGEYLDHGAEMLADDYFALNHIAGVAEGSCRRVPHAGRRPRALGVPHARRPSAFTRG